MNSRQWFHVSGSCASAILSIVGASLLLVAAVPVQAQGAFTAPTTAIGVTSATQTVTVGITTAGTLAKISVLTQGATGLDYVVVAGGTCTLTTSYTVGQSCTVKFSFTPSHPWVRYGGISLSDASGILLGNSFLNGVGTGPQVSYPLSAATVPSLLGSGFSSPLGVAVDGSGNVYVADTSHNSVKELMAVGGTVVTWSGFSSPSGVAVDGSGNVYVADTGNNAVKEMVAVGGVVPATPTIVPLGSGYSSPTGVAVDGSGNVYVADMNHNAVKELVAVGGVIPSGATPTPLGSGFSTPEGVAVDGSGDVFVADTHNNLVKEIVAVGGVIPASPTITPLGSGYFQPSGVAVDGSGNVYVADTGNNKIKEIVAVGGVIPSSPTITPLGTGFNAPGGVGVDAAGDVYVADTGNSAAKEMSAQSPPTLTFASAAVGVTSSDSPKTLTVANNGNAPLIFSIPATGNNPNVTANFSLSASSSCPQLSSTASSTSSLVAGSICNDILSFLPTQSGSIAGSLVTTDNNLNGSGSTQSISLSGTGTAGTLTVTAYSPSAVVDSSSVTLTASVTYGGVAPTGAVTFTVNGGSPIAANCPVSPSPLTCTASYNPSSLTVTAVGYPIVASVAADGNYNTGSGAGTLTMNPAATTLTISPTVASTVDASVTFTATLASGTGFTPIATAASDTVSFTANGVAIAGCTGASLSTTTHTASCTTSSLAAPSASIVATFNPVSDANFLTSTAATLTQTVNPAATTLTISPTVASTVDASVTFTATLASGTGFTPIATAATDTVSFTANGTTLCTGASLSQTTHTATCTTSSLVVPSDVITASFAAGDSNFVTSTAPPVTQVITKNTPSNGVVSSLPTTAVVNQTVIFTATITPIGASSSGVLPTGSITFTKGGSNVCVPVVVTGNAANGTGTASCSVAFASPFSATGIVATYSGDSNFGAGTAASALQTVLAAPTATTVSSNLSSVGVNQNVNLTATVTPANTGAGFPGTVLPQTGSVSFSDSAVSGTFCVSNLVAGVVPPCSHAFTSLGSHTITASFTSSDSNFSSTTTAVTGVTITVGTSGVGLTLSPATGPTGLTVNQSGSFTAGFTNFPSGLSASPGTVTYFDGTTVISGANCTNVAVPASGTIPSACSYSFPTAGQHSISAVFTPGSGGSSFQSLTSNSVSVTIAQTATTAAFTSPTVTTSTTDQLVTFAATVTPATAGSINPSGTVTFAYSVSGGATTPICTPSVSTTAGITSASCTAPLPSAGSYTVTAAYSGDSNFFKPTTSPTLSQTVGKTGTSVTPTLPTSATINVPSTYTAAVSLTGSIVDTGLTLPTGTVTFTDSTNPTVTCTTNVAPSTGLASCALTPISAGTAHTIAVSYSGDANFAASTTTSTEPVGQATPTITIASSSPVSVATQTVTFTATVTVPSTITLPSKTVTFTVPSPYLCSSVTQTLTQTTSSSTYTFTCPVTFPLTASFSQQPVSATYGSGDPNYASTTITLSQTVQNFTLSSTPATLTLSQGSTNLTDAYTSQAIVLTEGLQNNFSDPLVLTCAITPVTTGLTCTPNGTTGATITAGLSVPLQLQPYTVTYTVSDSKVPALSYQATESLTIVNRAPTVYVTSLGTAAASFTSLNGGLTPQCSPASLPNLVTCSQWSSVTANGTTTYNFTITTGTQSSARLETGHGSTVLACLGAPFLLMLGLLPSARKFRKGLLNGLTILALGVLLMHATGCGSGGFSEPQGTHATGGNYVIDIVSQGATVAEVPLDIEN